MHSLIDASITARDFHNIAEFFSVADDKLFSRISHNLTHVLKPLLPAHSQHSYNIEKQTSQLCINRKEFTTQSPAFHYQT